MKRKQNKRESLQTTRFNFKEIWTFVDCSMLLKIVNTWWCHRRVPWLKLRADVHTWLNVNSQRMFVDFNTLNVHNCLFTLLSDSRVCLVLLCCCETSVNGCFLLKRKSPKWSSTELFLQHNMHLFISVDVSVKRQKKVQSFEKSQADLMRRVFTKLWLNSAAVVLSFGVDSDQCLTFVCNLWRKKNNQQLNIFPWKCSKRST